MGVIGLIDGKMIDVSEKLIEMEDRGYQFGDGVYEVTRVYNGRCFSFKKHMDRLYRSLRELRIPATYTVDELAGFHETLIKESGLAFAGVYLQITRGVAPRGHAFPDKAVPRLTMSIRASKSNVTTSDQGAKGIFTPDIRWLRCDIKSLNLLGNMLAKQAAKEAGAFEAIQVRDGIVTEGSSSNFFVVKDGVLWTHPLNNFILGGINRAVIIDELAPKLGLTVVEKNFDEAFALKADEAFISGTNSEITPIVTLDSHTYGDGRPGPVSARLVEAFRARIMAECGGYQ